MLQDPELQMDAKIGERRMALREIANETFDFEETAKRALAGHWRARTNREQQEFVQRSGELPLWREIPGIRAELHHQFPKVRAERLADRRVTPDIQFLRVGTDPAG